jgi:hypothetical protein
MPPCSPTPGRGADPRVPARGAHSIHVQGARSAPGAGCRVHHKERGGGKLAALLPADRWARVALQSADILYFYYINEQHSLFLPHIIIHYNVDAKDVIYSGEVLFYYMLPGAVAIARYRRIM